MLKFVLIFLLFLVVPRFVHYLYLLDFHKTAYIQHPGRCRRVSGTVNGSEDLQYIGNGLAVITSGLRLSNSPVYQGRVGKILLFDFNDPSLGAVPLTITGDFNGAHFNPHGVSSYKDPAGNIFIYVINHKDYRHSSVVEKFLFADDKTLQYEQTFGLDDPAFYVLNDLTVVGPDQFYFTNWLWTMNRAINTVENMIHIKSGSIGYFDGSKGRVVVSNIFKPNGITSSKDGRMIYLANTGDRSIVVYKEKTRGTLVVNQTIDLYTSPDNINIVQDDNGTTTLYVGCNPIRWRVLECVKQPVNCTNPTQVLRIVLKDDHPTEVAQLLSDDGQTVPSSSAAYLYKSALLIGGILSRGTICDVMYIP